MQRGWVPGVHPGRSGTEFVSRDLELRLTWKGVILDFSRPGKPTDNAFIASFDGKFRPECLNQHWFLSLDDAVRKCEAWRRNYNEMRPLSAIGYKPPTSLAIRSAAHAPALAGRGWITPQAKWSNIRSQLKPPERFQDGWTRARGKTKPVLN